MPQRGVLRGGVADGAHIVVACGGDDGARAVLFHLADKVAQLVVAVFIGVEHFVERVALG